MKCIAILAAAFAITAMASHAPAETLKLKVADIKPGQDPVGNQPMIALTLDAESAAALASFTKARVGEQVTLRVGEKALSAPIIREPILGGTLVISGGFGDAAARDLARAILDAGNNIEVDGSDK